MSFKVYLKPNHRIFINGAVVRVDKKTTFEFLNDVNFLLESQVLQPEEADSPLKQLYYVVQMMLMSPYSTDAAFEVYRAQLPALMQTFTTPKILHELKDVDRMVHEKNFHAAMKAIRNLFSEEALVMAGGAETLAGNLRRAARDMREADQTPAELRLLKA